MMLKGEKLPQYTSYWFIALISKLSKKLIQKSIQVEMDNKFQTN